MRRALIDILDLTPREIDDLIDTASDIMEHPYKYRRACEGKKLAALFFEPSTRTRLSFEAAMYELGGHVLSVTGAGGSSVSKGESIADTARTVSLYADIIAMRHPQEGAALVAARSADIPVINAGDGGHCHPTQTLADLMTIRKEKGGFEDLTVGVCGDLKYGRTVHSLVGAMSRYKGVRFVMISPEELKVPGYVTEALREKGIPYTETFSLEDAIPELDILYMTRVQRERFDDPALYEALKDTYILTPEKMAAAKEDMIVLHPLPRVNEISVAVDADPRACYFKEMLYGKFMREALILKLLDEPPVETPPVTARPRLKCVNPRCISRTEQELAPAFFRAGPRAARVWRCLYCEAEAEENDNEE